jgi:hypothetical protein
MPVPVYHENWEMGYAIYCLSYLLEKEGPRNGLFKRWIV